MDQVKTSDNKIIAVNIVMKSSDGRVQKLNIERNTPIKSIEIYVDKTKNKNFSTTNYCLDSWHLCNYSTTSLVCKHIKYSWN